MPKTSVELREERATLVNQARDLQKAADAESRELSNEESEQFDRIMVDVDKMKDKIDKLEKLETAESEMESPVDRRSLPITPAPRGGDGASETRDLKRIKAGYRQWLRNGSVVNELRGDQNRIAEYRDTIIGTDAKGGYLIAPVETTQELVKLMDNLVFVRKLATIRRVTEAKALGIRTMPTRMAVASWTTEVQAVTEDTTMAFGRRDLTPILLSKLSLLSLRTLLLAQDAEDIVNGELAYQFGITQESAFMTGTGSGQPLGVFTADANGVPTTRDVTAASSTVIAGDDLIGMKYSIRQPYWNSPSFAWMLHRLVVKNIRKIKFSSTAGTAGDQQYIWTPGLTEGAPDRILDVPYYMSEYAPSTQTTGLYTAVLGDFKQYWIAEVTDFVIQRLVELYAATNQVGFIGRIWVDGAPVIGEAFARLKMA